ncbi:MAG: hypothetical protein K2O94_08175 [Clostridiales bacterium]|nr:hypothetical protein [Clostridiales bacterium]
MKNQSRLAIISQTSIFYIEKQSLIPIIPSLSRNQGEPPQIGQAVTLVTLT